jgi:hypothetical protein
MKLLTILKYLVFLSCSVYISGCANLTHFNKERTIEEDGAVFIDAKQRGVYRVNKKRYLKGGEGVVVEWQGICAEPAPDAISALASTLGLDLTLTDKGKLGVSNSISEGVGSIGIRTAAIEALRDIMYRNCEAYAIGGISDMGLETLQRRFQSTMVAILAIEQLTGAVKAPSLNISSSSSSGSADAIIDLTNKSVIAKGVLDSAKEEEGKANTEYQQKKSAYDEAVKKVNDGKDSAEAITTKLEASRTDVEKQTLKAYESLQSDQAAKKEAMDVSEKQLKGKQEETKKFEQAYSALESSRVAAVTGGGKTSTTATLEQLNAPQPLSDSAIKYVSDAVVSIAKQSMKMDFGKEVCTTLVGQNHNEKPEEHSPLWACVGLLLSPPDEGGQIEVRNDLLNSLISGKYSDAYERHKVLATSVENLKGFLTPFSQDNWDGLVDGTELSSDDKDKLKTKNNRDSIFAYLDAQATNPDSQVLDELVKAFNQIQEQ